MFFFIEVFEEFMKQIYPQHYDRTEEEEEDDDDYYNLDDYCNWDDFCKSVSLFLEEEEN
jgi:hypothetical protein